MTGVICYFMLFIIQYDFLSAGFWVGNVTGLWIIPKVIRRKCLSFVFV